MIFISHRTKSDHGHALLLKHLLEDQVASCWIAPENVDPGDNFEDAIRAAIGACQVLLVVVSPDACEHPKEIVAEIKMARQFGKRIIPIKFGTFALTGELVEELKHTQYKSIDVGVDEYDELLKEIKDEIDSNYCMNIDSNRTLSLVQGSYSSVMQSIIDGDFKSVASLDSCLFAMGINSRARISENNSGGIFPHVCTLLADAYGVGEGDLQDLINEALKKQHGFDASDGNGRELQFGDCVEVRLTVPPSKPLRLLLVVNSRTPDPEKPDQTEGPDPRRIILSVFSWCEEASDVNTLVIGAMGTGNTEAGGFGFPYDVVVAEIANATLCAKRRDTSPQNVICTVRDDDLRRHNLPKRTLVRYLWNVRDYFDRGNGEPEE